MGQKLKIVLSDLHIGAGYPANQLEDFRANESFVEFLHQIARESERDKRETELIINGDFFEFLQVPAVDNFNPAILYPPETYLDSSQDASIKRLNIIAEGHTDIFNALSDFMHVETAQRSITIIKGNHDVNLFWPGVKSRLREILGASGRRASLLRFADEFVSREKIYVEHGHQHAERMNGSYDSFDPRSPDDHNQLFYPVGSQFVINFFNQIEADRWFVDHIKPIPTLIWYALRWDFDLASRALVSLAQITPQLAADSAPWPDASPTEVLLAELDQDDKRQSSSTRYHNDPAFRLQLNRQIQHFLDDINPDFLSSPHVMDDPLEMGRAHQEQQHTMLRQAAQKIADREGASIILFGHSHYPTQEKLSNGSTYINTGSWVEDFSDAPHQIWQALFSGQLPPSSPPARLPYARIDYDEQDLPSARLLYFNNKPAIAPPPLLPVDIAPTEADTQNRGFFAKIVRLIKPNK